MNRPMEKILRVASTRKLNFLVTLVIAALYRAYQMYGERLGGVAKRTAVVFATIGLMQSAVMANETRDAIDPHSHSTQGSQRLNFHRIRSIEELNAVLAQNKGKTVMLDFYADWCAPCIEMERRTFSDFSVQKYFANMLLLQVDVTANDVNNTVLLKRFKLFGPPGIIFFDKTGREIPGGRVIGYQNAEKFVHSLELVNSF